MTQNYNFLFKIGYKKERKWYRRQLQQPFATNIIVVCGSLMM